jgi:MbtH protein
MLVFDDELQVDYIVVVNDEEQYSIWPSGQRIPAGWQPAGKSGSKRACLEWIDATWTDMGPRSVRDHDTDSEQGTTART